jgi:4-amino-4-deoxy-L-arabinose transferase-like glycosyltransferase
VSAWRQAVLRAFALPSPGTAPGPADRRLAFLAVLLALAVYAAAFLGHYPSVATNDDEARYLRQATLLLQGTQTASWIDPLTGETVERRPSEYPVGTAALMAPFVWLLGERGAWLAPFLSLVLGVLCTARWLADEGRSPLFALVVLGFPATLVLGRVAISDAPSLGLVALGLWLFWRGLDRGAGWWLAAGFVAGASMAVRETNALPFAAFFAGAVLRRERRALALVAGGAAGVCVRLVAHALAFGDPLYARGAGPLGFGLHAVADNWLLHALALLVLVPGGLPLALAYRGRRRPELLASVVLFAVVYFFHWFGPPASGFVKRLVLELRYFAPLLPILAFALAESVPRLWGRLFRAAAPRARGALATATALAGALWLAGVVAAAGAVHVALFRWSGQQAVIRDEIHRLTADSVLVTNWWATKKFVRELDREYLPVDRDRVGPADAAALVERYGGFAVALLDRSDSEYWRRDAEANAAFVASLSPPPDLELDRQVTPSDRLRIWRVNRSGTGADTGD